jgi:hypothetical protein
MRGRCPTDDWERRQRWTSRRQLYGPGDRGKLNRTEPHAADDVDRAISDTDGCVNPLSPISSANGVTSQSYVCPQTGNLLNRRNRRYTRTEVRKVQSVTVRETKYHTQKLNFTGILVKISDSQLSLRDLVNKMAAVAAVKKLY